MKFRRHHNNKGYRQTIRGKTRKQVKRIAQKLGIPYEETQPPLEHHLCPS